MKSQIFKASGMTPAQIKSVAAQIDGGAVCVFPTDTVYGIGTNAFKESSIERIYQAKNRPPVSPLQILTGSVAQAQEVVQWTDKAAKLARAFWPGALTMILPASKKGQPLLRGFEGLGLRVPGNAFLVGLLRQMTVPMASTSANLHGLPVITQEAELLQTFDGLVDIILLGGTLSPVASTVVEVGAELKVLREAAISRVQLESALAAD